ncbi:MAG: hypothetical protein Kow0013_04460 [Pararhodobacter sp.]
MTRENVADILCIGAQRTMTSWLHQLLSAHPGTWAFPNFEPLTSTNKEAHFWDRNRHRGADWYRVLMRPLDDGLKSLDCTPEYAFLSRAQIAECKALSPGATVIYLLRDPLARAISAIRMHTMWATGNAAPDAHRITFDDAFRERCKHARLWQHGDYAANVARWREQYPDMLVLNYEEVAADPVAAAHRIAAACGLKAPEGDDLITFETRAARTVWQAPRYPLDPACIQFLHGALWPQREACANDLGLTFAEGDRILEDIR